MRRLILLAAVLALLTAACKIETNIGAIINADGSGTIVAEIGVDDEAAEFFLQDGDPFQDNDFADLPGARTREERRGDLTYYIVEVDVDDVASIENELLGSPDSLLEGLTIDVTDDRVTIAGSASAQDTLGEDTEGFDPSLIEDAFSASVYFTMPGAITSHNADRQEGNTLFWDIPVLGGSLDIQAESDPTGTPAGDDGGFPVWAYGVLALIVIAGLWYFMKGRSGGGAATAAPPTHEAPTAQAPPAAETPTAEAGDDPPPPPPAE